MGRFREIGKRKEREDAPTTKTRIMEIRPRNSRKRIPIANGHGKYRPGKPRGQIPITNGRGKYQKCEETGIMGTLTGDQNVSPSGFNRNSFLIARGCAPVPFNAIPVLFLVIGETCVWSFSFLFVWWGSLPVWWVGSVPFLIGRPFWWAFIFFALVAASFRLRASEVFGIKGGAGAWYGVSS